MFRKLNKAQRDLLSVSELRAHEQEADKQVTASRADPEEIQYARRVRIERKEREIKEAQQEADSKAAGRVTKTQKLHNLQRQARNTTDDVLRREILQEVQQLTQELLPLS